MKIYLAIGFLAAYGALISWGTWQICTGKEAKKDVKTIETKIESHNENVEAINETVRTVEKIVYRDREKIVRIPTANVSGDCPIDELTRVRNESYKALNKDLFQSPN